MTEIEIVCLRLLLETLVNRARSSDLAIFARKMLVLMEGLEAADIVDGPPTPLKDNGPAR